MALITTNLSLRKLFLSRLLQSIISQSVTYATKVNLLQVWLLLQFGKGRLNKVVVALHSIVKSSQTIHVDLTIV